MTCRFCEGSGLLLIADVYASIGSQRDSYVAWELSSPERCPWCLRREERLAS